MPTLGVGSKALTKWDTHHLHCLYGLLSKHYPGQGVKNILVTEYQTETSFKKERTKKKSGKNRTGWKPETTRRAGLQEIALISY